MDKDISNIVKGWKFDPAAISARWIEGQEGRKKVQLRLDLGLFQMEASGRPDGTRPRGCVSLLEYYQTIQRAPGGESLTLDFEACTGLQQESMQYYYRYLAFYALHHLPGVIEDTDHNLDILDLVSECAEDDDIAWQFLQFFPYVRMMNARARAEQSVQEKQFEEAVAILEDALEDIRGFWTEHGDEEETPMPSHEEELLTLLLRQIVSQKPKSRREKLSEELDRAIKLENYEKAAILRDALGRLVGDSSGEANHESGI